MNGVIDQKRVDALKEKQPFSFEDALFLMRVDKPVRRSSWKDIREVRLQTPDEQSKMRKAYFYCIGKDHQAVPYIFQADDILNTDWVIAE